MESILSKYFDCYEDFQRFPSFKHTFLSALILMNQIKGAKWLRKKSWKELLQILFWVIVWLKLFDVATVKVVDKWRTFFSYYEGYRLPASIAAFIPFTIETLRADSAYKIVFTGDSTSGGFLYHHSQAIPAYLNSSLNVKDKPVHVYNLAFSGAHLSEQYLLMKETISEADMIIFPIHYSFFSGRGPENSFISHPELRDFLYNVDKADLSLVGLNPRSLTDQLMGELLGKIWYTYRVHRLLPYIILGKPVQLWLRDKIDATIPLSNQVTSPNQAAIDSMVPFCNQSEEVRQAILIKNRLLWERIKPVDETNVNLQYLIKIGLLSRQTDTLFLAYFVPLDITTLETNKDFDKDTYEQIIKAAKQILTEWKVLFIDLNEGNPAQLSSSDFYNPDHLLPGGNQKVGDYLAERIWHDL